jgi:hypothetical protein
MVVRAREWWHWVLAGALFGLAWLTRSTAVLVIPAIAVWVIGRRGVRKAVVSGALCAIGTLVVISPWLVRNARVRGGPFVSDSSFYLLIDYFAKKGGRTPDELYRSIGAPPAQADVADLIQTAVAEVPETLTRAAAAIAQSNVAAAIVLMAAILCGAWCVWHRSRGVELAAAFVVFLTMLAAFAIRGEHLEPRYLAVCFTLLGLLMLAPFGTSVTRRTMWLRVPVLIYALVFLGPQLWRITNEMRAPDPELRVFQVAAKALHRGISDTSAVITHLPYLFTLYTGRHAVSPPYPGKQELLRTMQRYRASHLFLPADRFAYYYRGGPASLGPELTAVTPRPHYLVLQRRPPTTHDLPRRSGISRAGWHRRAVSASQRGGPGVGR